MLCSFSLPDRFCCHNTKNVCHHFTWIIFITTHSSVFRVQRRKMGLEGRFKWCRLTWSNILFFLSLTLRAPLSGTFLQTLPDLVASLKGHSLSPHSCPATWSAPSKRFGYWYDCRSNLAPKYACKHEMLPSRVYKKRKEFCLDSNDCGFICAGVNFVGSYKLHTLFYLSCL